MNHRVVNGDMGHTVDNIMAKVSDSSLWKNIV